MRRPFLIVMEMVGFLLVVAGRLMGTGRLPRLLGLIPPLADQRGNVGPRLVAQPPRGDERPDHLAQVKDRLVVKGV